MTDAAWLFLSKFIFSGSVLLIAYIVYKEIKIAQINLQKKEIELGEKENEDRVRDLSDDELIDIVNKEHGLKPPSGGDDQKG